MGRSVASYGAGEVNMHDRLFVGTRLLVFLLSVVLPMLGVAQPASATWALTADTTAVVTGNVMAAPQFLSDTMSVRDFTGGAAVGLAERIWRSNLPWPEESDENSVRYIQYSVSPTLGNNFIVQSVTCNIGCYGTNDHLFAKIFYSTDPTFISRTELDSLILPDIRSNPMAPLSFTPNITVGTGETFYVRVYPWYDDSPNSAKYVCLTNVVISGITSVPGAPALSVFPDSLSFGSVHTGAWKELSYVLSGSNLSPESGTVSITAPSGFEVWTEGGPWNGFPLEITYTGRTLDDTMIMVRFAPSSTTEYRDTVKNAGGGAATQNVLVTGKGVAPGTVLGYFVSPDGLDTNTGSFEFPFKTIPKAVSVAQPGDTIFVRGGRYLLNAKIGISKSGTGISRYYLFAYPGERPVLDFSAMAVGGSNRGVDLGGSYWHIKGLDIYKAGDNGMNISGSNNTVEFCSFYENYDTGLQLGNGAAYNRIINCDSYFNADPDQADADGFAPKLSVGTGNYFYGCRSWQNSDDGWDGYMREANDVTTTLEHCWTFMNGYLNDGTAGAGNGNGFKMGGSDGQDLMHNMILKNCLAFQNLAKGFDQNHDKGSMTLDNCTGFGNGTYDYAINEALNPGKTLELTNCLSYGTINIGTFAVQTTNSWQGFTVTAEDFVSLDTTGVRGPRKADGSLPDIDFMHLNPASDLINQGTDIGLPYLGIAPDLGCFEYDPATGIAAEKSPDISGFQLVQNYPNPFNPSTTIQYTVPTLVPVSLVVYDVYGREVTTLVGGLKTAGSYRVVFDGSEFASGVYFVRLKAGTFLQTIRIVLVK